MALVIKLSQFVHTFTSESLLMSDAWCQLSDCHGLYMPSLTKAIRCLTDGVNHPVFWSCTYFHL